MCDNKPTLLGTLIRDYGLPPQVWDDLGICDEHEWDDNVVVKGQIGGKNSLSAGGKLRPHGHSQPEQKDLSQGQFCQKCSAWRGSLGLEPTPELYIQHIVQVFREIWRVLRKDGTVFLNLGDSYFGSGKGLYGDGSSHATEGAKQKTNVGSVGVPRAASYDTSGKVPEDYQDHGCLCKNLCDVCREVYQNHRFRNDNLLVSMLIASLSLPNHGNRKSKISHSSTLDFSLLENRILTAIQDYGRFSSLSDELLHTFQESMPDEFSQQLLAVCWRRGNDGLCLFCSRSLTSDVQESEGKSDCSCGTEKLSGASNQRKLDNVSSDLAYLNLTTPFRNVKLKNKDLCMIPARVALALQADRWWLRSAMPWVKRSAMPESVTDRPASALEYIFLLSKNKDYYFDMEAIRKPSTYGPGCRWEDAGHEIAVKTANVSNPAFRAIKTTRNFRNTDLFYQSIEPPHGMIFAGDEPVGLDVNPQSFTGSHFATFAEKLISPLIKCSTSECGCCPECGAAWTRIIDYKANYEKREPAHQPNNTPSKVDSTGWKEPKRETIGWKPSCSHKDLKPIPCTVCDCFGGSGRTAIVAKKLGRKCISIELKSEYCSMSLDELRQENIF